MEKDRFEKLKIKQTLHELFIEHLLCAVLNADN